MSKKRINQATFDEVVKENIEEFELSREEAVKEALKQFESQGMDWPNVSKPQGPQGHSNWVCQGWTSPTSASAPVSMMITGSRM
jgi:hypothetical protein